MWTISSSNVCHVIIVEGRYGGERNWCMMICMNRQFDGILSLYILDCCIFSSMIDDGILNADISTRALRVWRKYVKGWHPSNALNALNLPRFTHTHFHFCRQTASLMCHVISERTSTKQRTASISTWLGQSTVTSLFEQIRMFEYRWIIKFYFHFRYLPKSAMVEWNDLCAIVNPACSVLISITRSTHHTLEWFTVILEAM